jgi:hypothetical protein
MTPASREPVSWHAVTRYLLFLKRPDQLETAEELKANREKKPMQKRFFRSAEFVILVGLCAGSVSPGSFSQ